MKKNKKLESHPIFKLLEFSKDKFSKFQDQPKITNDLIEVITKKLKSELNFIDTKVVNT